MADLLAGVERPALASSGTVVSLLALPLESGTRKFRPPSSAATSSIQRPPRDPDSEGEAELIEGDTEASAFIGMIRELYELVARFSGGAVGGASRGKACGGKTHLVVVVSSVVKCSDRTLQRGLR